MGCLESQLTYYESIDGVKIPQETNLAEEQRLVVRVDVMR